MDEQAILNVVLKALTAYQTPPTATGSVPPTVTPMAAAQPATAAAQPATGIPDLTALLSEHFNKMQASQQELINKQAWEQRLAGLPADFVQYLKEPNWIGQTPLTALQAMEHPAKMQALEGALTHYQQAQQRGAGMTTTRPPSTATGQATTVSMDNQYTALLKQATNPHALLAEAFNFIDKELATVSGKAA